MTKKSSKELLIGAHMSAQGGAYKALLEGASIEATTIQLFTSNQKQWRGKVISDEDALLFQSTREATGISQVMSHDSYLINLGCPNPETLAKSKKAFKEELERCQKLDLSYLNFHPGAALTSSEEQCLNQIVTSLLELEACIHAGSVRLLIETTAGQGSCVGWKFEQLGYLIERLKEKIPIGICIDTCHIFAAGYDIRTKEGWDATLEAFEKHIGLDSLYALHVNDSLKALGSRRDRHAPLGKGEIGIECFEVMMSHPKLKQLPKYLETPDGPPLWKKEIALLRQFAS